MNNNLPRMNFGSNFESELAFIAIVTAGQVHDLSFLQTWVVLCSILAGTKCKNSSAD